MYHQLVDTYESTDSEIDVGNEPQPSTSSAAVPSTSRTRSGSKPIRRSSRIEKSGDWKMEGRALLEALWQCEDSAPFREPVDRLEHPGKGKLKL